MWDWQISILENFYLFPLLQMWLEVFCRVTYEIVQS